MRALNFSLHAHERVQWEAWRLAEDLAREVEEDLAREVEESPQRPRAHAAHQAARAEFGLDRLEAKPGFKWGDHTLAKLRALAWKEIPKMPERGLPSRQVMNSAIRNRLAERLKTK